METTYFLAVYACDTQADGTQCGPETRARCDRAIKFVQNTTAKVAILLSAGKRPDKPAYPPLKEIMRDYLQKNLGGSEARIILPFRDVWGTFKEIEAGMFYAKEEPVVYLCSTWYELPRIRFIWFLHEYKGKLVNVPASTKNWVGIFLEPIKIVKAFVTWLKNED